MWCLLTLSCLTRIKAIRYEQTLPQNLRLGSFLIQYFFSFKATTARLECAATALLCLLRSWPGLLHLTAGRRSPAPHLNTCQAPCRGPLASLLDTLYLPSYQARRAILDLLYRSLNIQVSARQCWSSFTEECFQVHDWTDEFDVAIKAADLQTFHQDAHRLLPPLLQHVQQTRARVGQGEKILMTSFPCDVMSDFSDLIDQVIFVFAALLRAF